jgi:hypothetical protein
MRFPLAAAVAVLVASSEAAAQKRRQDIDVLAADGARLRATYWSPGKPGPGMLLLHQCNMDRRAWTELGAALAEEDFAVRPSSTHNIHLDDPELVARAVVMVVEAATTGAPLPAPLTPALASPSR